MAHLLSECPNCRRTYLGRPNSLHGRAPKRCRVCGVPLVMAGGEKEAEVQAKLYGSRNAVEGPPPALGADGPESTR